MKTPIRPFLCLVIGGALASCQTCKIEPPPNVVGTNKEMSAKAAANALGTAISGVEAGGSYKSVVNNTYQTVGQDDVAFYLLLQAYNCESARGHTAAAAEILRLAREELARRHDVAPPPPQVAATSKRLTKTERHVLRKSPLKTAISTSLASPIPAASPTPAPSPTPKPAGKDTKAKPSPSPTP